MLREEPYQALHMRRSEGKRIDLRGAHTGAAWLSSARVVRCSESPVTSATLIVSYTS